MCDCTTNLSLGIANLDPPIFPKLSIRRMQVLELQSAAERAKLGFTSTKKGLSWKIIGISPDPLNIIIFSIKIPFLGYAGIPASFRCVGQR